jgi:hypothetical protein
MLGNLSVARVVISQVDSFILLHQILKKDTLLPIKNRHIYSSPYTVNANLVLVCSTNNLPLVIPEGIEIIHLNKTWNNIPIKGEESLMENPDYIRNIENYGSAMLSCIVHHAQNALTQSTN